MMEDSNSIIMLRHEARYIEAGDKSRTEHFLVGEGFEVKLTSPFGTIKNEVYRYLYELTWGQNGGRPIDLLILEGPFKNEWLQEIFDGADFEEGPRRIQFDLRMCGGWNWKQLEEIYYKSLK